MRLSKALWSYFERTGSVVAYLLYCRYLRLEDLLYESQIQ